MIHIPITEERKTLKQIIQPEFHYPKGYRGPNLGFDPNINGVRKLLHNFPDVKLHRAFVEDNPYVRCQWFAFGEQKWYQELADMDEFSIELALIENGFHVLKFCKFEEIPTPVENSTAVYHFAHDAKRVEHYGIYSNGRVRSKWSNSHAYEHPIGLVPSTYGDTVRFYLQ